jgi:hypothetical protein
VTGLVAGSEPETALLRAGSAGLLLAALSRVGIRILEAKPKPSPEDLESSAAEPEPAGLTPDPAASPAA